MELFVHNWGYNFDRFSPSKMYTGEIITVAIILPDSLSPVKQNPEKVSKVLRLFWFRKVG